MLLLSLHILSLVIIQVKFKIMLCYGIVALIGLGIYQPYTNRISGGFAGKHGNYGPLDGPTGYLAPNHQEILDYNIVYDFNFSIILGTVQVLSSTPGASAHETMVFM